MKDRIRLNLALQGGGAHGAFTWGVLDRLLEEPWFEIEGVSGTSAGAMNALMLAEGWRKSRAEGAREQLALFWEELMQPVNLSTNALGDTVGWLWQSISSHLSPYDLNPFDINPLRDLLEECVDFEALRRASPFKLYIAATAIENGKLKLFRESELKVEHLLASACLPRLHQAVEIEGRYYWDGGFAGNPVLYPLLMEGKSLDLLMVLLQPMERASLPTSSQAIADRVAELGFQTAFMREMRAVVLMQQRLKRRPWLLGSLERRFRHLRFHLVGPDETLASLHRSTKYDTSRTFLYELRDRGRDQASRFISLHGNKLGKRTSCVLQRNFL
ncbi:patatin-like phospholipase family protein [Marinobacterium mangrovicola]|uniref:NTE family protein n=1 Tax=Marinobacterium mangrovicola TaxID=1476959 RepID=A0A4V6NCV5_9GAMM|nr:patatin-like phospholipase family protein [Marinobacterium mangrovicola]TCK02286.1 NTE family protein [Marinobacterium mangrovicola]